MGLQAAPSNKRKYDMNASCDDVAQDDDDVQTNCTPSKNGRWSPPGDANNPAENDAKPAESSTATSSTPSATVTSGAVASIDMVDAPTSPPNVLIGENSIAKLEAVTVPGETWNGIEPIVDSISKLQAVAVPGESWPGETARSALATTLLTSEELDDDDDEFEDDFEDDETLLSTYSPIRYPCSPSRSYPAYPKPGYFPESYHQQNCSRTSQNNGPPAPTAQQPPQPQYPVRSGTPTTPVVYNGGGWNGGGGGGQNFYSPSPVPPPSLEHHPASQLHHPHYLNQQQTIRCAENGKSYFELGSPNYCNQNFITRHIKRCCDGRNNWCNNKQCYKERRMKMMNLSMFKLSRFRQSADQSLYRSVLICNTLKYIEKEIDKENKEFRQQHMGNCGNSSCSINQQQQHMMPQHGGCDYGVTPQKAPPTAPILLNQQIYNSDSSNMNTTTSHTTNNTSSLSAVNNCNTNNSSYSQQPQPQQQQQQQQQQSYNGGSPTATPPPTSPPKEKGPCQSAEQPSYDLRHPLKDPQFGRATPFPVTTYMDTDSGYGGDDAEDDCTRSINWGSVLSLSSQSALDPLNNNDLFSSPSPPQPSTPSTTTGATTCPPTSNLRNIPLSSSNDSSSLNNGSATSDSHTPAGSGNGPAGKEANNSNTSNSVDLITLKSSNSPSATLTTLLTTATTSISITPTSPSSSVASLTPTHWNFDYLDMELGGTTHEIYDILPNCYKFTTFTTDDFVKSSIMEPTKVVGECDTLDTFTTHIMVGS